MATAPRKRMTASERREQLLDVGGSIFAEKGYDASSVEEIAQKAGVTKPVVYEHFGGKEGLYAVIVDREMREVLERITRALEPSGAFARLEAAAEAFLRYIEERPDGFRVLLRDAPLVTGGATPWGSLIGTIADRVDALLADELSNRGFDRSFAPLYSRAVMGLIANVGQWWLETGSPDRRTVAAHMVNIVWNGLEGLEASPMLRFADPDAPDPDAPVAPKG
ncbi:MAG: TetR/AcrR family transcriptional regulator [Thermoleophilia bacterium]|nr:TetR/AcrR family transcriptional regulator [Thermoleophilia bacterium]